MGLALLAFSVWWPEIKKKIPPSWSWPRTLHERVTYLEDHGLPGLTRALEEYAQQDERLRMAANTLYDTKLGALTDRLDRLEELKLVLLVPALIRCFHAIDGAIDRIPSAVKYLIHVSRLLDEVSAVIEDGRLTYDKQDGGGQSLNQILERHRQHFDFFVRRWQLNLPEIQHGELFVAIASNRIGVTNGLPRDRLIDLVNEHLNKLSALRDQAGIDMGKPVSNAISSMDPGPSDHRSIA